VPAEASIEYGPFRLNVASIVWFAVTFENV
jgi:hypothetical protein